VDFSFVKYEGLGNDFLVVDQRQGAPGAITPEMARRWCDRRFGVGGDGVLVLTESPQHLAHMTVLNADGSQPEMCGNGLRCVAAHLAAEQAHLAEVTVDTPAGPYRCAVQGQGGVYDVTVPMGQVRFGALAAGVPQALAPDPLEPLAVTVGGQEVELWPSSTGNPHALCVAGEGLDLMEAAERLGPLVGRSRWFPAGVNVAWARVQGPRDVELVVYERGAGLTLACGTGATASVAVLARLGLVPHGEPVRAHLPGGALEITVAPGQGAHSGAVTMRGAARRVFSGELAPRLARPA
jgi:diaminopimelate epimerase